MIKKQAKLKQKKLVPSEWYSLQDIVRDKMIPWARSFPTIRRIIELDNKNKNILKPMIKGDGRAKKYQFKGENIINFVKAVEAGKVRL